MARDPVEEESSRAALKEERAAGDEVADYLTLLLARHTGQEESVPG